MSLRPTCAGCNTELTCIKNEVLLVHFNNNDREQGVDVVHFGDLWGCKNCDYQFVMGLGNMILGVDIANPEEWFNHYRVIEVKR